MEIKVEDFGEEFKQKFSQEHQEYILNFCNTFQKVFPDVFDKEEIVNKILSINKITPTTELDENALGITTHTTTENEATNHDIKYEKKLSGINKKNIIYHELLHVFSHHQELWTETKGMRICDASGLTKYSPIPTQDSQHTYEENETFDEIMNEFYTIKLLELEEKLEKKEYSLSAENSLLRSYKHKMRYYGDGYTDIVQLAELLHNIFGNDLIEAKFLNGNNFREKFNQKYKDIEIAIPPEENLPHWNEMTRYHQFQFQIGLGNLGDIFKTLIDMWKINEKACVSNDTFNLYDYLKKTNELISFLPVLEDNNVYRADKSNNGIHSDLFEKINKMDKDIILQYLRPDLNNSRDDYNHKLEMNTILAVMNILRENIQELTESDIKNLSYGQIEEYSHSNRKCLVINANKENYMTFVEPDEYNQFNAYSKFKPLTEFTEFGFSNEDEEKTKEHFAKYGYELQDFSYASVPDTGRYSRAAIIESNGVYYSTIGDKPKELQLSDVKTLNTKTIKSMEDMSVEELENMLKETLEANKKKEKELKNAIKKRELIEKIRKAQEEGKQLDEQIAQVKSQKKDER